MSVYLIGDVQGCHAALQRLLHTLDFSPSRDTLYLLGDLVNRGPDSLGVLRQLRAWSGSAHALLGNHDIHLLAVHAGIRMRVNRDIARFGVWIKNIVEEVSNLVSATKCAGNAFR